MIGNEFEKFARYVLARAFASATEKLKAQHEGIFIEDAPLRFGEGCRLTVARQRPSPPVPQPSFWIKDDPGEPTIQIEEFDPGIDEQPYVFHIDPTDLTPAVVTAALLEFAERALDKA